MIAVLSHKILESFIARKNLTDALTLCEVVCAHVCLCVICVCVSVGM